MFEGLDKETLEFFYEKFFVEIWMIRGMVAVILFRIAGGPNLIRALWRKRNGNATG